MLIPHGYFNLQTLGWPGNASPSPFGLGLASDNRVVVHWDKHNPSPGVFVWDDVPCVDPDYYRNPTPIADQWRLQGRGVWLETSFISYRPAWVDSSNEQSAFAAFSSAVTARIKPIRFEPMNEPATTTDWAWAATMCRVARTAVKAVDAKVKIAGPSCESISNPGSGIRATNAFLQAGGVVDEVSVHLYPHGLSLPGGGHDPITILDQGALLVKQLAWAGPIVNTESGQEKPPQFFQQSQAEQLRQFDSHLWFPLLGTNGRCVATSFYAFNEGNMGFATSPARDALVQRFQQHKSCEGDSVVSWTRGATVDIRLASGKTLSIATHP